MAHETVAELPVKHAGLGVIAPLEIEAVLQLLLERRIVDRADNLKPAVKITRQEVG